MPARRRRAVKIRLQWLRQCNLDRLAGALSQAWADWMHSSLISSE